MSVDELIDFYGEEDEQTYGMVNVHSALLVALKELDCICRKNEIFYSLHGGTILGAERNHKFIPWDDDVDISMTRDNYERFLEILTTLKGDYYFDEKTTWVPRFAYKEGDTAVFISIFVWDYISEKKLERKLKIFLLRMLQGMLKKNIDYSTYNLKNKVLVFGTHVMGMPFSYRLKKKWQDYIGKYWLQGRQLYIHRSNDAHKGVSYIFDADYMSKYEDIEFEGGQYMVTSRYREFLEINYGSDYMTPPSKEKRRPEHTMSRIQMTK